MKKGIFLVGMPGAGKTGWGRRVAARFALRFYDTDEMIEQREGKEIPEIFEAGGEPYFRALEQKVLAELVNGSAEPFVCSTGGGLPADPVNFRMMKEAGVIIYLKADINTLMRHLQHARKERPLLAGDTEHRLQQLLSARKAIYEQADYTFDTAEFSPEHIKPIIDLCIKQQ